MVIVSLLFQTIVFFIVCFIPLYSMQNNNCDTAVMGTCLSSDIDNALETDAVYSVWKDMSLTFVTPQDCIICQKEMADGFRACSSCNTLYFNVIEGVFNAREQIASHPLSNFYSQAEDATLQVLRIDGCDYVTAEHYFQAQRSKEAVPYRKVNETYSASDLTAEEKILTAETPGKAWYRGKKFAAELPGESQIKIMKRALAAKFTQNQPLQAFLLHTGNAFLVYRAGTEPVWGDGSDGKQGNILGLLLMQLRDILLQQSHRIQTNPSEMFE